MEISIIVPVYNVEKYLDRCMGTLLNQKEVSYEILLIDDGSKDNSGSICEAYANKYNCVRVIHKNNEGLGLTRNRGILEASGDFILFVDSDDYIKIDCLKDLHAKMVNEELDVCIYKRKIVKDDKGISISEIFPERVPESKAFAIMSLGEPLKKDYFEVGPAWKAIYRREFLLKQELVFRSERDILSEDYLFSAEVFLHKPRVGFIDADVYYYCFNGLSLSKSYNKNRPYRAVTLYKEMLKIIGNNDLGNEAYLRAYNNFMINLLVSFKHICFNGEYAMCDKLKEIKSICEAHDIRDRVLSDTRVDTLKLKLLRQLVIWKLNKFIYLLVYTRYSKEGER